MFIYKRLIGEMKHLSSVYGTCTMQKDANLLYMSCYRYAGKLSREKTFTDR